ncbi:hypothetical protein SI65_09872 [Aspergillus cristatus]|uniref:Altered inheritance of mitochondria protein 24, mitochondrial n=1 Tax=Aspergillus cristatus TaxID=573508 RepID=A0A1E3B169_ASPCR|nr:hypothetical protein SI65_09872 [Aspergillus cristatus]
MSQQVIPQHQETHNTAPVELKPMESYAYPIPTHSNYYPPPPQPQSLPQKQWPTPDGRSDYAQTPVPNAHNGFTPTQLYQQQAPQQQTVDTSSTDKDKADGKPKDDEDEKKKDEEEKANSREDHVGSVDQCGYRVSHRDANALLTVYIGREGKLIAKPGAMISKTSGVDLKGSVSFSWMKVLARSEFAKSVYEGEGLVTLAPSLLGDVLPIRVNTVAPPDSKQYSGVWKVGRDAFLASSKSVDADYETQGLTNAVFSGEGFFVYKFSGDGVLFVQSFGAIVGQNIPENETFIVDNGHLVAWNCKYDIRRVASGGIISGLSSREGLGCKFYGPGFVFYQTRRLSDFAACLRKAGM